jgi:hypothetical protein
MTSQKKGIQKTICIIVAIMVTILILFFNKITTPRYLSDIELKVNGLELIAKAKRSSVGEGVSGEQWILLVDDSDNKQLLDSVHESLKGKLRKKVLVVYGSTQAFTAEVSTTKKIIPIIKPSGEFVAYFKAPFDKDKMVVTLSSVVTHR